MRARNMADSLLTRRAFLGFVGKGAGVFAIGGLIRYVGPRPTFARPPGAVPEEQFLSLCIRCHRCQEVCPYREIRPVLLTESMMEVGTPVLVDAGYCPRCRRCVGYCPTGALR